MISVRGLGMRLVSGGHAVDVLSDVSLEVPAGQFLAIAGPSGSGKSTLLGLMAGLDQPTAGRALERVAQWKLRVDEQPGVNVVLSGVNQVHPNHQ